MEKNKQNSSMELINRFSRKKLSDDEVYIFNITLCDNEIDRDFEAFSPEALESLGKLFIGKTGISDHSMRSSDQAARIFNAFTERIPGKKTSYGTDYVALKASAYMVRTDKNRDLIKEIDAGIKKEISVGCAVGKKVCSICGKEKCSHIRGEVYSGKTCFSVLTDPTDAYEWSFVAVPAQREAGVTKAFSPLSVTPDTEEPSQLLKKALMTSGLSEKGKSLISDYISEMEKSAEDGRKYRSMLIEKISSLILVTEPDLASLPVSEGLKSVSTQELAEMKNRLEKRKSSMFPPSPQTAKPVSASGRSINDYII